MIQNYFRIALRHLRKNKGYAILNMFGLALGMACALLILLWVQDEVSYDNFQEKYQQLYIVKDNQTYDGATYTFDATPGPLAAALKAEVPGIVRTARVNWTERWLYKLGDKAIYEEGNEVDPEFLQMFSFPLIKGDSHTALNDANSVVISEKLAKQFFPDEDPIGKTLKVNDGEPFKVTGVIKNVPSNSAFKFDWLVNFQHFDKQNPWLKQWGNNGIITYAELESNASAERINKRIYSFIVNKSQGAVARVFLFPMKDWRLRNNFENGRQQGGRIEYVRLFSIIALLIIIIACINFMNLATARSEQRAREVGVRKVMGAGRSMLVRQFIGESLIMSFVSAIIALFFVWLVLPYFNSLVTKDLHIHLTDPVQLFGLVIVALVCGLLAGSYPAFYLSSFNPIKIFRTVRASGGSSAVWIRKGLVVTQFVACVVLIISTIIIYKQLNHIMNRQLGYQKENLLKININNAVIEHLPALRQDLLATGVVKDAATSNQSFFNINSNSGNFNWQGKDPNKQILISIIATTPHYLSTTGIKLKSGRDFYENVPADSSNIMINETFAKIIGHDPINSIISHGNTNYHVIGVMHDYVFNNMYASPEPLIMLCMPKYTNSLFVRLKNSQDIPSALKKVQNVLAKYNPGYPFEYAFADDDFNKLFKSEMLIGDLSKLFAGLTILISCIGLFGLAAYTAERRTKEIGIRKVIGASVSNLAMLLSVDFIKLVLIAILIACPIAWYIMHRWLNNYAYRIDLNIWIFAGAALISISIALITVSFQAIKAAVANPVKSLRSE